MRLKPVDSEMLELVGYDAKQKILEVVFNGGDRYQYLDVAASVFEELMAADSLGQYMHKHVIGHYDYKRV